MRTGPVPSSSAAQATTVASVGPYVFHTSRSGETRRAASSGGTASPPKIRRRTFSIASAGHNAASVGTVETTEIPWVTIQGPRSMPLRTRLRGAGTRHAPCRHASHISSQDASKATERPASTRSPGPSGAPCRKSPASASTKAAADRCVTATPFGVPVEPEVKMIHASSSSPGGVATGAACVLGCGGVPSNSASGEASGSTSSLIGSNEPRPVTTPRTPASPNTRRARSSGSSASTGTYAAPAAMAARIAM